MVFLFSPDISLFDFLPDFIGWSLIALGLVRLADIEMRAEDARNAAKRMILISLVKAVLALFTFRFSSSDLLLASFAYAIVEIITVFPFVRELCTGLDYCAMRVDAPLDSDRINLAKWYLYVFFAVKNTLAVAPSAVSLFDSRMTGDYSADTWFIDFDAAMRVLMVFSFFLSAVIFIVMLAFFIPFWRNIAKDRDLNSKMAEHRRVTVLEVPSRMLRKNTGLVLSLFAPVPVFFFDFYLDGIDVLPTFIGFAAMAVGSYFANKRLGKSTLPLTAVSVLGFGTSLTAFLYKLIPLAKNSFVIDYAFSSKPYTLPLSALTSILTALAVILVFRLLGQFNKEYTKYHLDDSLVLYMIGGVIIAAFDLFLYAYPDKNTTFVFPSLIFGISVSALSAYYVIKLKKQIDHDNKD